MKKILITGGLGNLGSWLTEYFSKNQYDVYVLTKNKRNVLIDAQYKVLYADLALFEDIKKSLDGIDFDYVIHAGSVNDAFVNNYYQLALEVNTLGTRHLLEYFKDKNLKHFIYFSTFQVYGKYAGTIDENTPTNPINDYGNTHLFAEYYVKQLHTTHKIPYTIFRLTNSYGCPKDINSSKWYLVLNDLSKSAFEQKKIILKSNGQAARDFICMSTVSKIVKKIVELPATNDTYNISGEQTYKMIEIANFVQQAYKEKYGTPIEININVQDKTHYDATLKVSSQKLKKIISYTAENEFIKEAKKIFELLETKK
jgi:UDP-glucose 4-epimerase